MKTVIHVRNLTFIGLEPKAKGVPRRREKKRESSRKSGRGKINN